MRYDVHPLNDLAAVDTGNADVGTDSLVLLDLLAYALGLAAGVSLALDGLVEALFVMLLNLEVAQD